MENNSLKLFAGYQFKSSFYTRADLEGAVLRAVTLTNEVGVKEGFQISFKPPDLAPGQVILSQILERIKESDICIFEISDGNRNVLFEVGVAVGLGIPTILLRHTSADLPVPSDLSGVMYLRYSDTNELSISLPSVLTQVVETIPTIRNVKIKQIANLVWSGSCLDDSAPVSLIGGEIKTTSSPSHVPGVFYMQSPDVQALVEAGGNLKNLSPDRDVRVMSSGTVTANDLEQHLVLVGGPRSNSVTGQILQRLSLPWKYKLGDTNLPIKERMKSKALVKGKEIIKPEFDNEEIKKDVALLSFGPNPFNMSKRFLLLTGAFTFGVMGATRSISFLRQKDQNIIFLKNLCESISHSDIVQIVMQVDVVNSQVITPNLEDTILEIIK